MRINITVFKKTGVLELKGHDAEIADATCTYLRKQHDKPFLTVASFTDPHDICQYANGREIPGGELGNIPSNIEDLPPLPENMAACANESHIMQQLREGFYQAHSEMRADTTNEIRKTRKLVWAYHRFIERVDALIGKVLNTLEECGLAENTIVLYTSDHGELLGSHGLVQKSLFFEESTHVPFYVKLPHGEHALHDHLVNNGPDILSTLLSLAGIEIPSHLPGRAIFDSHGKLNEDEADYVIGYTHACNPKLPVDLPSHTYTNGFGPKIQLLVIRTWR